MKIKVDPTQQRVLLTTLSDYISGLIQLTIPISIYQFHVKKDELDLLDPIPNHDFELDFPFGEMPPYLLHTQIFHRKSRCLDFPPRIFDISPVGETLVVLWRHIAYELGQQIITTNVPEEAYNPEIAIFSFPIRIPHEDKYPKWEILKIKDIYYSIGMECEKWDCQLNIYSLVGVALYNQRQT